MYASKTGGILMRKVEYVIYSFYCDYYEAGPTEKEHGIFDSEEEAEEYIHESMDDRYTPREIYIKKVYRLK